MRYLLICLTLLVAPAFAADKAPPPVSVSVETDRENALYHCGETATFRIAVTDEGKPVTDGTVSVVLTRDGGKVLSKTSLPLEAGQPVEAVATLGKPAFVRAEAVFQKDGKRYVGLAGAGFDPEGIQATTVDPEDFDAFWATARSQLAKMPYDVRLAKLETQNVAGVESYGISFANIDGSRAYGFLSIPTNTKGPFPAYVTVPGAGPGPFGPATAWASRGCLTLQMSVHAYDATTLGKGGIDAAYKELNASGTYSHHGKPDREKFYFYRAILGVDRAITWLSEREDWDGKHLVIDGSSQGGAFALIMAGLNEHITAAAANVPALGEHAAFLDERQPGWPNLTRGLEGKARDDVLAMSAYYDTVNFARRIKCPAIVSAGFIDRTCPPSTVYAAYNQIKAPKRMFNGPLAGHQWTVGDFRTFQPEWLAGQLGIGKTLPPE
jgi:cephalosporin-C deacetylase-like acetyl esterase